MLRKFDEIQKNYTPNCIKKNICKNEVKHFFILKLIQNNQIANDIRKYKVVQTGPKTHDGGLKDG